MNLHLPSPESNDFLGLVSFVCTPWRSISWKVIVTTDEPLPSFPGNLTLSGACVLGWYTVEVLILEGDLDHR